MGLPDIGQLGNFVHLRRGKRPGGRVDQQELAAVLLQDGLAHEGIVLVVLYHIGPGVGLLAGGYLLKRGNFHPGVGAHTGMGGGHAGAPYIGDLIHRGATGQPGDDLLGGQLAHAIGENVCLRVKENGAANLVLPVVVVGKAAQRGLQAADDDGNVAKGFPHPVGVDHRGVVGTQSSFPAGRVGVVVTAFPGGGIVGHHGVQVACRDHHRQPGTPKSLEGGGAVPVWLGENGHPVAFSLQHPANNRRAEGGMVHVGVAGDEQHIVAVPAPAVHILPAYR